jgi:tetratricopeptide (TPR) repeat protein
MGLLGKQVYDRRKLLAQASQARSRGRIKKAIRLYQRVLEVEPSNIDIHRKIAPLLARSRQREAALASFREAMAGLMRQGFDDKALAVCHEATRYFPQRTDIWEAIANLELRRRRAPDAVKALRNGRRHCRGSKRRGEALRLLRRAQQIAPDDVDVATDLSRLLVRTGARQQARQLLAALAARAPRTRLRRIRWAQLRVDPTPMRLLAVLVPRLGR